MPKYKLPPLKERKHEPEAALATQCHDEEYPTEWDRQIRIPASDEVIAALTVGQEAKITLIGSVDQLSNKNDGRTEVTLFLTDVEAYPEKSDEDRFEESFNAKNPAGSGGY